MINDSNIKFDPHNIYLIKNEYDKNLEKNQILFKKLKSIENYYNHKKIKFILIIFRYKFMCSWKTWKREE